MKTPLGTEVDLSPGHIVLNGDLVPPAKRAQEPPLFRPCLLWPRPPISSTAELVLIAVINFLGDRMYRRSAVAEMVDGGHNRHEPKRGEGCCAPFKGKLFLVKHNMASAKVYFRTKWQLHPSSPMATLDIERKLLGRLCLF